MAASDGIDNAPTMARIVELLEGREQEDYEELLVRLNEARSLFQSMLAARLTEAFNAYLSKQPSETTRQKQHLAQRVNADLRSLGLAIRCPKTGEPALLRGDHGGDPVKGRFQLGLTGNANFARTLSFSRLLDLDLMDDRGSGPSVDTPNAPWSERVKTSRDSARRPEK